MKLSAYSAKLNPVYVLVLGVLGGSIPFLMYMRYLPVPEPYGPEFTSAPSFFSWVFLLSVLFAAITILLVTAWKVCLDLYSYVVHNGSRKSWTVIAMLVISTIMYLFVLKALLAMSLRVMKLPASEFRDQINYRFPLVYFYSALGFLPVMFSIILINYIGEILSSGIPLLSSDEGRTMEFIQNYLYFRNLLQVCLVVSGIFLSLNPIITAAYLTAWKEIGVFTDKTFPTKGIIVYGLILTLLLILIYVPTYFNLLNVGKEIRDARYPFPEQIDDLKGIMEKRKTLDELLQTNIGITENLKNGIFTLSPLVSGLIAGFLGLQ